MTRTLVKVIVLVLAATPVLAQEDKAQAKKPAPATVAARCTLKIAWAGEIPRPDLGVLVTSRAQTKDASQKYLNRAKPPQFRFQQNIDGTTEAFIEIDPRMEGIKPAVAEFTEAILDALPKQLEEHQQEFITREIDQARKREALAENRFDQVRVMLDHRRKELRKTTGRADAVENWAEAVASLEQERQKLALDLAGQQARRQAIEEAIAKVTKEAEARVKDDSIAAEFSKILVVREKELAMVRALFKSNDASDAAVADMETKVADAKANLLERRELATRSAGGEILTDLNRELLMLSINGAEHEARLRLIKESLDRFHAAVGQIDGLKRAEKELLGREADLTEASKRLAATEDRYQNVAPPTVSVIDCDYVTLEQWRKEHPEQP